MILEEEKNLISILCAAQKKQDSVIFFSVSKFDGTRVISTNETGTISLKLNKSAVTTDIDVSFAVSTERLRSIMSWMPKGDIDLKFKGTELIFSSGKTRREITVSDAENMIPEISIDEECEDSSAIMNKERFADALEFSSYFKHKDQERSIGYVTAFFRGKKIYFIGSDGGVLGFFLYIQKFEFPDTTLLLGDSQLSSILSVIKESKNIQIKFDDRKYGIYGERLSFVGLQPTYDIPDYLKLIDSMCPRKTDCVLYNSEFIVVETGGLKRAISHCGSIFSKNDHPHVDISFENEIIKISSKSSSKGYDSVHEEVRSSSFAEKQIRLSPVLLNKALSKYDKICEISWRKDANENSPICISSHAGNEAVSCFVLLAPKIVKKEED